MGSAAHATGSKHDLLQRPLASQLCLPLVPGPGLTDCHDDDDEDDINAEVAARPHLVHQALELHIVALQLPTNVAELHRV